MATQTGVWDPYATDEANIARNRTMADYLRQQSLTPMGDTQMVSGIAVRKSPLEGLAKMLQAYSARKGEEYADQQTQDLASKRQGDFNSTAQKIADLLKGKPALTTSADDYDESGALIPQRTIPAVAPDPQGAVTEAMGSNSPEWRNFGMAQMLKGMEPTKFGNTPHYDQSGNAFVMDERGNVKYLPNVKARDKMEMGPAGQVYNPYNVQPGMVFNDPNKPFALGPSGPVSNTPYQQYELGKAKAGSTNVSVNTDKTYLGHVAQGLATNDVAAIDAARSAPDRIRSAQSVKALLDKNPITGTGAEARLSLNKALATAGLIDGKNVRDTETLASTLASQTLDAIKTSGLGSGQGFTDKDRQFLERAKSGNIEINAGTLRDLADLNERSGRASIQRGNAIIQKIKKTPGSGSMGMSLDEVKDPTSIGSMDIDALVNKYLQGGK